MPRNILLASLAAAGALALPAAAGANTFCVNAACPVGGTDESGNLQAALDAAAANPGPDDVLVGDKGSAYAGPFKYVPAGSTNTVALKGTGGRPVLAAGVGDTVLSVDRASVDGLDVNSASSAKGTGIAINSGDIGDVTVSATGATPAASGSTPPAT